MVRGSVLKKAFSWWLQGDGAGNARGRGLEKGAGDTSYTSRTVLSPAASVEEECSDSIPPERGERTQAPFRRPESMISGP